ncbi:hypothetical protein GPECTOR_138g665 [Gonium pectorale]|uniref:Uncharacterized protein n=1 Tax=Gonium pectorale TaxID=33097 RepID=A0A150FY34_GONPE|nr:hypothetical protein GPECTOR_138g665 [Gonium pectorale]|eukprot:KXZ42534.1 hypothetical protein GPECTOR_138g665 [Gonium pectorale]
MRDPAEFRAGLLAENLPAWRRYFQLANQGRPFSETQRTVLGFLEHGVCFDFVGAPGPGEKLSGPRKAKRRIVTQMLRQAVPGCDPETYLTGKWPHPVQFLNHRSTTEHAEFVSAEVKKALDLGVLAKWPAEWGRPTVVNGLRVVVSQGGRKLRLCMNPM